MNISELLDQAKENSDIPSDRQLALKVGVSPTTVCFWRKGQDSPTPNNAQKLADLAGIDAAEVVLDVLLKSAEGTKLKQTLTRLKSALAAAAVIMLTVLPGAGPLQVEENSTVNNIHYAQLAKAIFKALLRSFAIFPLGDPRDQATKMQSLLLPG